MDNQQVEFNPTSDQHTPEVPAEQSAPPIDPAAYAALEQQAAAARAENAQLRQQQMETALAQQAIQHEIQKRKVLEDADGDPEKIAAWYEQQRALEQQQVQAGMQQLLVNGYRGKLQQDYGLRPEQMLLLGEDPNLMEQRAQMLAQQNAQAAQFQQSMNTAFVGQQAQERVASNIDRIGGVRGGAGSPAPTYEKGSQDHLRALLFGE